MIRKNPNVDVIYDVLQLTLAAYPTSDFIKSLLFQYQERGGLSKKQLQDLHTKALKVNTIPAGKLATIEAIILKKATRFKSPPPLTGIVQTKNISTGQHITEILAKYPMHKMVLFLKTKYDNNEQLSITETAEVERFYKLLVSKGI